MQIALNNVSLQVGRPPMTILRNVTVTSPSSGSVAVMGPSGAGKSSLLSMLGNLQAPTAGDILWSSGDKSLKGGTVTSRTSWVFQQATHLPGRLALDNVCVGAAGRRGETRRLRERRGREALARVGLERHAQMSVDLLSGGEQQRVAIARAMFADPLLVLADEPTGNLDADTSEVVLDALLSSTPPEALLIVATHDPSVAARLDELWILENGTVRVG